MNSFITGSRAYGTPTKDSDVDLVIRTTKKTTEQLRKLSRLLDPTLTDKDAGTLTIRFGKLNLICCTTDAQFAVWKIGTVRMKRQKKGDGKTWSKKMAKGVLDSLRQMVGIIDTGDDSGERA